jgi:ribosome maturation factor RimP
LAKDKEKALLPVPKGTGIGAVSEAGHMENDKTKTSPNDRLIELIGPLVSPLGYEIVHVEVQTHRSRILRIFIDHLVPEGATPPAAIGVEDCARVARALDEPLDQMPEVDAYFKGSYELEVSSPGVDRPLRQSKDYERFQGREARIHVFRPLTAEELENSEYQKKNPKQKNFLGVLKGVRNDKVRINLAEAAPPAGKKKSKGKTALAANTNSEEEVMIPLPLISKANLEPKFEMFDEKE